jgi:hypothetical protein
MWKIVVFLPADTVTKQFPSEAADFFDALISIRRQLQREGLIPYCYGASLNVFPSAMARDMGQGLRAYKLVVGKHATRADLVDIFDEGTDVVPADVDTQEQFYRDWLGSPRT